MELLLLTNKNTCPLMAQAFNVPPTQGNNLKATGYAICKSWQLQSRYFS
jgi:hypothetical protein